MDPALRKAIREASIVSSLGRFCEETGLGDHDLGSALVEAFCALGLVGRASSTRGTYRSVLRSLDGNPDRSLSLSYPGAPAPAPYSLAERKELVSMACSQPREWRRHSALALIALGIGAGLRTGEIATVLCEDVTLSDPVTVALASRVVPFSPPFDTVVAELVSGRDGYLFHPGPCRRDYKNFVNDFCAQLSRDPGSPRLEVLRCRSSFICDHLALGTPLRRLTEMAGIDEVESLRRHGRHVTGAPVTNAGMRRLAETR